MILVRTTLDVLPEKQLEVEQTLLSLIIPVGKEPGCISYCVFCDIDNKTRLTLLEEWETQQDLKHHFKSICFGVLLGTKPLLREPPKIQIFTASSIRGMEFVEAARSKGAL